MKEFDISKFDRNMAVGKTDDNGICWHTADTPGFRFSGLPFRRECRGMFRRLPLADDLPKAVDELAWHTAGAQLAFVSDTGRIRIRAKLQNRSIMDHMPATGMAGFDLYEGPPGCRRFQSVSRFQFDASEYEYELFTVPQRRMREFLIHFPLYSGVAEFLIGLDADAVFSLPSPWQDARPVVIYGSSITQGGCASRPGMAYPNILSRYYNRPFLNFGFSGSANGEPEVVQHWTSVPDPALFILCYEVNAGFARLKNTLPQALAELRKKHPQVPALVISKLHLNWEMRESGSPLLRIPEAMESIAYQRGVVDALRQAGDPNVYFVDGSTLSGADWHETTVDGCHPTDLGFYRIAENLIPILDNFLK